MPELRCPVCRTGGLEVEMTVDRTASGEMIDVPEGIFCDNYRECGARWHRDGSPMNDRAREEPNP